MNREPDFDQTLKDWLDEGSDHAPERFIWAALDDVERSAQHGAWRVSLEDLFVNMRPARIAAGTAAVIATAVIAYQMITGANVGEPGPSAIPGPAVASEAPSATPGLPPGAYGPEDLPDIVLTEDNSAESGLTVDGTLTGIPALVTPLRNGLPERRPSDSPFWIDLATFRDALMTNLNSTDTGGYVSWAAVFETSFESDMAYHFIAREHESEDGWGLQGDSTDLELGFESVLYVGPAYGWDRAGIYLWRLDNLVLAAVGVGDYDGDQLRSIANLMDGRMQ